MKPDAENGSDILETIKNLDDQKIALIKESKKHLETLSELVSWINKLNVNSDLVKNLNVNLITNLKIYVDGDLTIKKICEIINNDNYEFGNFEKFKHNFFKDFKKKSLTRNSSKLEFIWAFAKNRFDEYPKNDYVISFRIIQDFKNRFQKILESQISILDSILIEAENVVHQNSQNIEMPPKLGEVIRLQGELQQAKELIEKPVFEFIRISEGEPPSLNFSQGISRRHFVIQLGKIAGLIVPGSILLEPIVKEYFMKRFGIFAQNNFVSGKAFGSESDSKDQINKVVGILNSNFKNFYGPYINTNKNQLLIILTDHHGSPSIQENAISLIWKLTGIRVVGHENWGLCDAYSDEMLKDFYNPEAKSIINDRTNFKSYPIDIAPLQLINNIINIIYSIKNFIRYLNKLSLRIKESKNPGDAKYYQDVLIKYLNERSRSSEWDNGLKEGIIEPFLREIHTQNYDLIGLTRKIVYYRGKSKNLIIQWMKQVNSAYINGYSFDNSTKKDIKLCFDLLLDFSKVKEDQELESRYLESFQKIVAARSKQSCRIIKQLMDNGNNYVIAVYGANHVGSLLNACKIYRINSCIVHLEGNMDIRDINGELEGYRSNQVNLKSAENIKKPDSASESENHQLEKQDPENYPRLVELEKSRQKKSNADGTDFEITSSNGSQIVEEDPWENLRKNVGRWSERKKAAEAEKIRKKKEKEQKRIEKSQNNKNDGDSGRSFWDWFKGLFENEKKVVKVPISSSINKKRKNVIGNPQNGSNDNSWKKLRNLYPDKKK